MQNLTQDFISHQRMFSRYTRYKKFILPGLGVFLLMAGVASFGFFLYGKKEQKVVARALSPNAGLLPKEWLVKYFGTDDENNKLVGGPDADVDGDVLSNIQEFYYFTDPTNPDSDGDQKTDGAEVVLNTNPLGEGELYSTDLARKIADQFLVTNQAEEFKEENIQKQVLGILSPPKPEDVKIVLPDQKSLRIVPETSTEEVAEYIEKMNKESYSLLTDPAAIQQLLDNPSGATGALSLPEVYQTIDRLRVIAVPTDFVYFHQLHIAALFASANVLEVAKSVDPNIDQQAQSDKIREQYYQVAVIQQIGQSLRAELEKLKGKYKEVLEKYKI